jgi:hypothetical protein
MPIPNIDIGSRATSPEPEKASAPGVRSTRTYGPSISPPCPMAVIVAAGYRMPNGARRDGLAGSGP